MMLWVSARRGMTTGPNRKSPDLGVSSIGRPKRRRSALIRFGRGPTSLPSLQGQANRTAPEARPARVRLQPRQRFGLPWELHRKSAEVAEENVEIVYGNGSKHVKTRYRTYLEGHRVNWGSRLTYPQFCGTTGKEQMSKLIFTVHQSLKFLYRSKI